MLTFLLVVWTLLSLMTLIGAAINKTTGWAVFFAVLLGLELYALIGVFT